MNAHCLYLHQKNKRSSAAHHFTMTAVLCKVIVHSPATPPLHLVVVNTEPFHKSSIELKSASLWFLPASLSFTTLAGSIHITVTVTLGPPFQGTCAFISSIRSDPGELRTLEEIESPFHLLLGLMELFMWRGLYRAYEIMWCMYFFRD